LCGGSTFVVFKDIKISLVPKALGIDSFLGNAKKNARLNYRSVDFKTID
jgi:hypothetical protein